MMELGLEWSVCTSLASMYCGSTDYFLSSGCIARARRRCLVATSGNPRFMDECRGECRGWRDSTMGYVDCMAKCLRSVLKAWGLY